MALDEYGKQGILPVMLPVPVHVTLHDKSPLVMDLNRLLPKSAWGQYEKVGIPFVSRLMVNLCHLLQVSGSVCVICCRWSTWGCLSTLDLTKGYWQVALAPDARAFSMASGHRQCQVLPFGMPGAFQRLMGIMLCPYRFYAAASLDDVVMHSSTWMNHLHHLREVLGVLQKPGWWPSRRNTICGLQSQAPIVFYRGGAFYNHRRWRLTLSEPIPTQLPRNRNVPSWGWRGTTRGTTSHFSTTSVKERVLAELGGLSTGKLPQPITVCWKSSTLTVRKRERCGVQCFHSIKADLRIWKMTTLPGTALPTSLLG